MLTDNQHKMSSGNEICALLEKDNATMLGDFMQNQDNDGKTKSLTKEDLLNIANRYGAAKCYLLLLTQGGEAIHFSENMLKAMFERNIQEMVNYIPSSQTIGIEIFCWALKYCSSSLETIKYSLAKEAPSIVHKKKPEDGKTLLHIAAENAMVDICKLLLKHGAEVTATDLRGNTPLMACAQSNSRKDSDVLECAKAIVEQSKGTYLLHHQDENGLTPVHFAAMERKQYLVDFFIREGSQLNILSNDGETALGLMVKRLPSSLEALKQYMDEGVCLPDSGAESGICLDFSKLNLSEFSINKFDGETQYLFLNDEENEMENSIIEHPLSRAYLFKKFIQVRWIFISVLICYFIFSVAISLYCGLIFSYSCAPDLYEDEDERKDFFKTIDCHLDNTSSVSSLIIICWIFNLCGLVIYSLREVFRFISDKNGYFKKLESWRNIFIIITVILVGYNGYRVKDQHIVLYRWQFHVAAISCLVIWIEMMHLVGRLPMFGKYVQMFKAVSLTIFKFFFPFVFIMIGFMMSFMILFSYKSDFQDFPGAFVKLVVMMLGEIDYGGLYFPVKQKIVKNATEIENDLTRQPFPGTAQMLVILFVALVPFVIMNLLVGLAVSDIKELMVTGKRDQLIAKAELIHQMEKTVASEAFQCLPQTLKHFIKSRFIRLNELKAFHRVDFSHSGGDSLSRPIKRAIFNYLMRKKDEEKMQNRDKEMKEMKESMNSIIRGLNIQPLGETIEEEQSCSSMKSSSMSNGGHIR